MRPFWFFDCFLSNIPTTKILFYYLISQRILSENCLLRNISNLARFYIVNGDRPFALLAPLTETVNK